MNRSNGEGLYNGLEKFKDVLFLSSADFGCCRAMIFTSENETGT